MPPASALRPRDCGLPPPCCCGLWLLHGLFAGPFLLQHGHWGGCPPGCLNPSGVPAFDDHHQPHAHSV
eukprot:2005124-Alexandrium_andersonii.AAC.1